MMLAVTFSFVMLGFGGAGGIINMSYQLNETVHNTQWVTGHFHLIFGGAIVIMYFMIAYELWPQLTRLRRRCRRRWIKAAALALVRRHARALAALAPGSACSAMPRADGVLRLHAIRRSQPQAWTVTMSTFGGLMLVASRRCCFVVILARAHRKRRSDRAPFTFGAAAHPGRQHARRAQRLRACGSR